MGSLPSYMVPRSVSTSQSDPNIISDRLWSDCKRGLVESRSASSRSFLPIFSEGFSDCFRGKVAKTVLSEGYRGKQSRFVRAHS
jgi:hypothetical protein